MKQPRGVPSAFPSHAAHTQRARLRRRRAARAGAGQDPAERRRELVAPAGHVHAVLGDTHDGAPQVAYAANGAVATYLVSGSILNFSAILT